MKGHPEAAYRGRLYVTFRHILVLMILLLSGIENVLAAGTPATGGDTAALLTIRTAGSEGSSNPAFTFTKSALENLPQQTIRTKTPWTDGTPEFSGPLVKDVLRAADRNGKVLHCIALNDYTVDIPIEDIERHQVILAMKQDGKALSVREKGPLWVIFPWSENSGLWSETYFSRSIWQLKAIELR